MGSSAIDKTHAAVPLPVNRYGEATNELAWKLFFSVTEKYDDSPLDTGVSAAVTLMQMAGISLGSGERGIAEAEKLIKKANLDSIGGELFKLCRHRSSYKWFPTVVILVSAGRELRTDYVEQCKDRYGVQVRSTNLEVDDGRQAVALINQVVAKSCENRVQEVMSPDVSVIAAKPDQALVTASAVYFHAWWHVQFDRKKTTEENFSEHPQKVRRVPMMKRDDVLPYVEGQVADGFGVQVVGLACRNHGGTVYFFLPTRRFGLRDVIRNATTASLTALIAACTPKSVDLWLPKFVLSETRRIHDSLAELGLQQWFRTTLTRMTDDDDEYDPLYVSDVISKIVVRVNEDGQEIDTGEKTEEEENEESRSIRVRCDHPFMFIFRHEATKAFWLIGTVSRPVYPKKD